jgi:hypothetical protein
MNIILNLKNINSMLYSCKFFLINLQFFLKNNRLNKGEYARKNGV